MPARDAARSVSPPESRSPPVGGPSLRNGLVDRSAIRLGLGLAGLPAVAGTATAHGAVDGVEGPVTFAFVVGLPVVAGLLGGFGSIRLRNAAAGRAGDRLTRGSFGLLLAGLGVTLALDADVWDRQVAAVGLTVGVVGVAWVAGRGSRVPGCRGHDHLTVVALGVHRVIEGLLLGALYATGAVVGLVAAVVVAGHAALETAAIGGSLGSRERWARVAVVFVQVGFGVGAAVGVAVGASVPEPLRVAAPALAGGVLLAVGSTAAWRSLSRGHRDTRSPAAGDRSDVDAD